MMRKNPWLYYGQKLLIFLLSVLLLSVITFYIARLAPGDPLVSYYGDRVEKMKPEERAWAEEKLGLNAPIHVQYVRWLSFLWAYLQVLRSSDRRKNLPSRLIFRQKNSKSVQTRNI